MTKLTTWDNKPRELWVEDKKGRLIRKFIVFYDPNRCYGLDKEGNKFGTAYEKEDLKSIVDFDEFKQAFLLELGNREMPIDQVIDAVMMWTRDVYLPNHNKQFRQNILIPIISKLRELRNNYDLSDVTRNRFRFSPNEQFLAKEFYQKINSLLDSIEE